MSPLPWQEVKWETIYESSNTEIYAAEVILVHDLLKKSNLREQVENFVRIAISDASEFVKVSFRISVYRFNRKEIRDKGEFETASEELLGKVQKLLDAAQRRSLQASRSHVDRASQPPQLSPKILFITYELGAWFVRRMYVLLSEISDPEGNVIDHSENPLERLAGIIFVGADEGERFEHSTYLQNLLAKAFNEPVVVPRRSIIVGKLRSVDARFKKSLSTKYAGLASTTWILPALGLSSLPRSESKTSLSHNYKSWRGLLGGPRGPTNLLKPVPSDDSGPDDGNPRGLLKFSHLVLQNLNKSEKSSNFPDEYQYIKRLEKQRRLDDSSGMGDNKNISQHFPPNSGRIESLDGLERYTSTESTTPGLRMSFEENSPGPTADMAITQHVELTSRTFNSMDDLKIDTSNEPKSPGLQMSFSPESAPGSPVEGSHELRGQYAFHNTQTMQSDFVNPMPENSGFRETNIDSNTKVEEKMSLAQSYQKRGQFDKAKSLCDSCVDILKVTSPYQQELFLRVSIQKALIAFQSGEYMGARDTLQSLRANSANDADRLEIDQITYQIAVVSTRLGDHHEAFKELKHLQEAKWFEQIVTSLKSHSTRPESMIGDPRVEIVLNTYRLMALLWGYYGHYKEATNMMDAAQLLCGLFSTARGNKQPSPVHPSEIPNEQGSSTSPTANETQQRQFEQVSINIEDLKARIDLASAKLSMLQGDDKLALALTRETLQRLEGRLGRNNILTLEAAALNALILSRSFDGAAESRKSYEEAKSRQQVAKAESVCLAAINAMSKNLGRGHPLTMEALSTLARIFQAQSRPFESRDTIATLLERAKRKLGEKNPQTLRYLCQIGDVDLYIGNYRKAKEELEDVCRTADIRWIDQEPLGQYPDVLKYKVKLAMAESCMGKITTARAIVKDALERQAMIYGFDFVQLETEYQPGTRIKIHPDVLESLAIHASILDQDEDQGGPEVLDAFEQVYRLRKDTYGPYHHLTLQSAADFGFKCFDNQDTKRLGNLADFFRDCSFECKHYLGPNHITTWRAKLGDLFNGGLEYEAARFNSELSKIMNGQTTLLGQSHPIVLDSLLKLFTIQLILKQSAAHATADLLLDQVRQPKIREQRLIETLQLEKKVATRYCLIESYEQGLPIFDKIVKFLSKPAEYKRAAEDLEDELKTFEEKLKEARGRNRKSAEALRDELLRKRAKPFDDDVYDDAESTMRRAASLSRSLSGNDPKTVRAFKSLAEHLHASDDTQKRDEGLIILGTLLASIRKVKLKNKKSVELDELYIEMMNTYAKWRHEMYDDTWQNWRPDPDQEEGGAKNDVQYASGNATGN